MHHVCEKARGQSRVLRAGPPKRSQRSLPHPNDHAQSPSRIVHNTPDLASRMHQNRRAGCYATNLTELDQKARCCTACRQPDRSAPCIARHSSCSAGDQREVYASNTLLGACSQMQARTPRPRCLTGWSSPPALPTKSWRVRHTRKLWIILHTGELLLYV